MLKRDCLKKNRPRGLKEGRFLLREMSTHNTQTWETCPSCAGKGEIVGISYSEEVFKCRTCGLFFLRESKGFVAGAYRDWYAGFQESSLTTADILINDIRSTYERQLSVLEKLTKGRTILDFGCGLGTFLAIAKRQHWQVYGIDASPYAANFAEKNFHIKYYSSLTECVSDSFDVVRVSQVLEHLPQPKEELAQIHRVLKKHGILLVIAPNCESLCPLFINRLRRLIHKKKFTSAVSGKGGHIIGFSVPSLTRMVTSLGFEPLRVFTVSMGSRTYYPLFYDGLLRIHSVFSISINSLIRCWLPQIIDNLGNSFNRGRILVGYFQKV